MRIYECTLYERPRYGDPMPVVIDGRKVSQEVVAENAGKARARYWRQLRDCIDVRWQDIRVRSLGKRKAPPLPTGWSERLQVANAIIHVIASHGRHFLSENSDRREPVADPFIAHFKIDANNELWFVDRYTRKDILVRLSEWRGFSDGGTLRGIIQHLAEHITTGVEINPGYFGISPDWMSNHWGYGDDMRKVADEVAALLAKAEVQR